MELPGIPDAKEPDGPEDGIVVLENNLGAAIEVTLDQEVKMLYPGKSWIFGITGASDKLMKVHCRGDPSILGTRQVEDGLALRASESFGSFGIEVADFLQKEQEEVEREKSLLQERKKRIEKELEKERLRRLCLSIPSTAFCLSFLVLLTYEDPEDYEASPELHCLALVLGLVGLCICSFIAQTAGLRFSGSRWKKLAYYAPYGCFVLGGLTVTIAIVRFVMAGFWWAVLAAGLPCCCISTHVCVYAFLLWAFYRDGWEAWQLRRQLPIGPLCSKAKFVQAPANVCAHGQASTSLLGTPWSQAAAVATSVQRWSFSQRVQSISAATTLSPKGKRYRAAAGAFPFMGSQSRGVAVGGQSG